MFATIRPVSLPRASAPNPSTSPVSVRARLLPRLQGDRGRRSAQDGSEGPFRWQYRHLGEHWPESHPSPFSPWRRSPPRTAAREGWLSVAADTFVFSTSGPAPLLHLPPCLICLFPLHAPSSSHRATLPGDNHRTAAQGRRSDIRATGPTGRAHARPSRRRHRRRESRNTTKPRARPRSVPDSVADPPPDRGAVWGLWRGSNNFTPLHPSLATT